MQELGSRRWEVGGRSFLASSPTPQPSFHTRGWPSHVKSRQVTSRHVTSRQVTHPPHARVAESSQVKPSHVTPRHAPSTRAGGRVTSSHVQVEGE